MRSPPRSIRYLWRRFSLGRGWKKLVFTFCGRFVKYSSFYQVRDKLKQEVDELRTTQAWIFWLIT